MRWEFLVDKFILLRDEQGFYCKLYFIGSFLENLSLITGKGSLSFNP